MRRFRSAIREKLKKVALLSLGLGLGIFLAFPTNSRNPKKRLFKPIKLSPYQTKQTEWADSVLATMTLDEKIGQFFVLNTYSNRTEDYYYKVEDLIQTYHIGGLIFFQGGPYREARLTNRYQALSKIPLFIGMDAEMGLGMRLDSVITYPKQMTLGAIQDNSLIEKMGQEIGKHCKRLGIHINFAPVVDINSNPHNPIIGSRSFGEIKENVAAKGIAYLDGLKKFQILATAKHFPGHGDTDKDSHKTLPLVARSSSQLNEVELYPFRKLIADSVGGVLTGHLFVPSLENHPNTPCTVSEKIVKNLLQTQMGFQGLTFTDALNMRAVTKQFGIGEVELLAFLAGNDVLLYPENLAAGFNKIKHAVEVGQISQADIDARVKKILKAKYWAGLHTYRPIELANLAEDLNKISAKNVKMQLFEQAVTVVKNQDDLLPILHLDTTSFASVAISADVGNEFQKSLSLYANFKHFTVPFKPGTDEELASILEEASHYKVVIVSIHDMNNSEPRNFGVTFPTVNFINQLRLRTKVIVVAFGNPYGLKLFENVSSLICGYEDVLESHRIVPQILFGALPAKGKLPVSAGSTLKVGDGIQTLALGRLSFGTPESVGMNSNKLKEIEIIAQQGISNRAFPGCQVVVARKGKIVYNRNFGNLKYDATEPVSDQTLYDIASMTKVSATLQAIMFLNEWGAIDLNQKISFYLPEMKGTNKENLLISDILMHQAGLVAFIPFWEKTKIGSAFKPEYYKFMKTPDVDGIPQDLQVAAGLYVKPSIKDSVWRWILQSKMINVYNKLGGYRYTYSDLGLIILQHLVEKITNQPLDEFMAQNFYEPIGMTSTLYNPLRKFDKSMTAPTENDLIFREQQIQGTVHDPNAALLGGVSGHAGLFSTATDLAKLFQMNLQKGFYGGRQFLQATTVPHFAKNYTQKSHRGLGWDKPAEGEERPIVGDNASPTTFGHSGFTGTVGWVDPDRQLIFIFLANRVYTSAANNKINTLNIRRRIHEVVNLAVVD